MGRPPGWERRRESVGENRGRSPCYLTHLTTPMSPSADARDRCGWPISKQRHTAQCRLHLRTSTLTAQPDAAVQIQRGALPRIQSVVKARRRWAARRFVQLRHGPKSGVLIMADAKQLPSQCSKWAISQLSIRYKPREALRMGCDHSFPSSASGVL